MTKLDALKANVSQIHGLAISSNTFAKALIDEGISENDEYSADCEKEIDLATIRIYKTILGSPSFSESDVNYNLNDRKAIESVIISLQNKWGIQSDVTPFVTSCKPW